jgi:membrane fusion protein (multidrug efflux system)
MAQEKPETPQSAGGPKERRMSVPRRRRWVRRVLLLLGPLIVLAVGTYIFLTGGRYVSTDDAYVKADLVMIGAEVSGLISEVAVHENQPVKAGDVLFRIDDRSYRIALDEAEAHLASVRDEIAGLKASYRQKQAELALDHADLDYARKEFDRQSKLVGSRTISRAAFDKAERDLDVARQQIRVAEQEMAQIRAQLGGDPDVPVERHARYLEALAARDRAALDFKRTVVRAPLDGVASNTPQVGQQVIGNQPLGTPVMSLVADSGVRIEANFKETDLTHVRPGQTVTFRVDTYPELKWQGTVQSISPATGAEFSVIPPQNATGNWVKVVQRIPVRVAVDTAQHEAPLRAGMSTSVEIDTGHQRALPGLVRSAIAWLNGAPAVTPADAAPDR